MDGKKHRLVDYDRTSSHTENRNSNSIGLSLAAMGGGFLFGLIYGILGLPELPMMVILFPLLFYINFVVYRWSVNKMIAASLMKGASSSDG